MTLGGAITIRLCMAMSFDTDTYVLNFYFDDGGGTLNLMKNVSLGATNENFLNPGLLAAGHIYNCVCWEKEHFNTNSVEVEVYTQNKSTCDSGGVGEPQVPITIIWEPITADTIGVPARLMQACSAFSQEHCNGLGLEMGFSNTYDLSITASSVGWVSNAQDLGIQRGPLLITCPSLPINGYIGCGGGGGMTAPILAVCGLNNQVEDKGFSGSPSSNNWIKLNNEYPLRLDRLNIKLFDATNREYLGLSPDFSTWLMFRCATTKKNRILTKISRWFFN